MTKKNDFTLTLYSFGYKYQIQDHINDVNFLYDVRSLPNPYWEELLRPLSGMDKEIAAYVLAKDPGKALKEKLLELLIISIEQHRNVGKINYNIAIGCTGGRHRSVAMVEFLNKKLYQHFANKYKDSLHLIIHSYHRDIEKDNIGV